MLNYGPDLDLQRLGVKLHKYFDIVYDENNRLGSINIFFWVVVYSLPLTR